MRLMLDIRPCENHIKKHNSCMVKLHAGYSNMKSAFDWKLREARKFHCIRFSCFFVVIVVLSNMSFNWDGYRLMGKPYTLISFSRL